MRHLDWPTPRSATVSDRSVLPYKRVVPFRAGHARRRQDALAACRDPRRRFAERSAARYAHARYAQLHRGGRGGKHLGEQGPARLGRDRAAP
jgi:hypothetical protein